MYKKIDKDNKIFNSENFLKDEYKFNLIFKNLSSPELELYSDEESYMFCRGAKNLPTWIWTSDDFDKSKILEIEELIKIYLTENERDKFTCKKELYDLLVERGVANLNADDYFEMGFLICHHTKITRICDGILSKPTESDKDVLAKYWYNDNMEMNGANPITMEQSKKDVETFINDDKFYVLRNTENKIVCMASYNIVGEQAKINHVYTPTEERKKGYAANLIYLMTNDILKRGLVPLLYTDYNYIPSNKAYINAGYEDKGILINFSCSREKKKTL